MCIDILDEYMVCIKLLSLLNEIIQNSRGAHVLY